MGSSKAGGNSATPDAEASCYSFLAPSLCRTPFPNFVTNAAIVSCLYRTSECVVDIY